MSNLAQINAEHLVKDIQNRMINHLVDAKVNQARDKESLLKSILKNGRMSPNYVDMEFAKLLETYILEFGLESYVGICAFVVKQNKE